MIWFSSDHHFYHNNVIRYCARPFSDVEEMNKRLVLAWNARVRIDDTVYYLGDFSMAFRSVEIFTRNLHGEKHLIHGNHDFSHPYHKKSRHPDNQKKWIEKYIENGWASVRDEDVIELNGTKFRLAHLPYTIAGDIRGTEHDKYEKYRPVDDGTILLCGHVHEKWSVQRSGKGTLMINVGVDRHGFAPISIDEVMAIVKNPGV